MAEEGTGRARGRSRGRAPAGGDIGEEREGSPTSGNGRGRGGYRALVTIPKGVTSTVGSVGTEIPLLANYLRIETPKNLQVHQYHVTFEPEVEATFIRRGMIADHREKFGNAYIFDGMSNLKTLTRLEEPFVISAVRKTDQAAITITLTHAGEVPWGSQEMLRLYNTQVRRNLSHLQYILMGRNYFDPRKSMNMQEFNLQIWPGLATAVNNHDGGTLMVCDTVHKVVRAETAYDVLMRLRQQGGNLQENARKELTGSIVLTSYNNKTYRIDDLVFTKNASSKFSKRGVEISFVEYYKQQYNITIRDHEQPLLQVMPSARDRRAGTTDPILLIPELCALTGLSDAARDNQNLKRALTQKTQAVPNERIAHLIKFRSDMVNNPDASKEMANWNLSIPPGIVELPGRQLPNELIVMANTAQPIKWDQNTGDFSREIRGSGMLRGVQLQKWCIIVSPRDDPLVEDFSSTLNKVCGPLHFRLQRPVTIKLENDRTGTFVDGCKQAVQEQFQMAVVIVPNNNKDRYDAIKKIFCCDSPMASQVIVGRTLSKKQMLMSVCTKVGIQMAVKLGAEAWGCLIPPKKLMVVGYDSHHDGTRRGDSVGGFVCSINDTLTRYYSRVAYHKNHTEMSDNFAANFVEGLKFYRETNKVLPERIVVYRDGVGEGQIAHVFDVEMKQIQEGIRRVAGDTPIRLSFIIVTKRVNSRFFLRTGPQNADNPKPGTVVDSVVTRKERYDFYLISQAVRAGTVAPTNFNIIEDESGWKPQHHQQLAYKLTHMYYNWMGTIRVPAPCQYAHKLAFLTGTSLHKEPNPQLADTLFYL